MKIMKILIGYNLILGNYKDIDQLVVKDFEEHLSDYYIYYFSDIKKMVCKSKLNSTTHSGDNIRNAFNLAKYFEVRVKNRTIRILFDILPLTFSFIVFFSVFLLYSYIFSFGIYSFLFFLFVAFIVSIISFFSRVNRILGIAYKVFRR